MSLCINPDCRFDNPDSALFCQQCDSELLLQERYEVVKLLSSQGGCADTYEVLYQGVPKILKVLKEWEIKEEFNKQKAIELFEREFQVLNQSNHPGIPKAEDYFKYIPKNSQTPLHCLVMEKIVGMNLEEYIGKLGRPIDQKSALIWLEQLVLILKEVHNQGLIHRDIKPSNIILKPNGKLVLIDFGGVGKFSKVHPRTRGGTLVRSANYTAEEQMQGHAVPQSDFFSLGRTFVYLLTVKGIPESQYNDHQDWYDFVPEVSPQFVMLINQLMAPAVEQRPANAEEILQRLTDLKQTLESPEVHKKETEFQAQDIDENVSDRPKSRSNKLPILLAGCVFLLLSGGGIYSFTRIRINSPIPNKLIVIAPTAQCSTTTLVRKSGNLYGVIEVGSKGIKGEVIQELATPDAEGFKFIARDVDIEDRNVNPIKPTAQQEAVKAVKSMFSEIQEKLGIPCEQIVIYGSSGFAQKAPHKDTFATEIQQQTGRKIDFISAEEEANFVFNGVVPDWRRKQVVMIDIGSGNTKGAYIKGNNKEENVTFAIPFGTTTFTDEINKSRGNEDFVKAATNIKNQILIPQIRDTVQRKPGMQNLSRVYLAGGISWVLSTLTRPCERQQQLEEGVTSNIKEERVVRFGRIYPEDINTFYYNATRDQKALFEPNLDKCDAERLKEVKKEIEKIKNDFPIDNLTAGSEILRALSDELYFSEKEHIFFARHAKNALPIGYLQQKLDSIEGGITQ